MFGKHLPNFHLSYRLLVTAQNYKIYASEAPANLNIIQFYYHYLNLIWNKT